MKKVLLLILVISCLSLKVFAQTISPTPIVIQVQPTEKTFFDYLLIVVQILTLLGLALYVYKTWQIASANQKLAEKSEESIKLSKDILKEMVTSRLQEIAPHVIVYFDMPYGDWEMFLVVKNTGKTVATDVKIAFDPRLQSGWENKISDFHVAFVDEGISSLAPGQRNKSAF